MKADIRQPRRAAPDAWRQVNAGRVLGDAVTRFESRVLELMATAGHAQTRLSHVNLTRHLDLERLIWLEQFLKGYSPADSIYDSYNLTTP